MKNVFLSLIAAGFLLTSCGGDNPEGTDGNDNIENNDVNDLGVEGMNEFSLVSYGLNLSVMLPEVASSTGASIEPTVTHDDGDYLWYLDIGNHFHLVIEDFGKEQNKVAGEKKRLADLSKIFKVEYTIDEPGIIMYKRELHEDQGGKASYHCYGATTVDGYTIVLRSNDDGGHKPVINDMVTTIKSAKELKKS
tara:strand:+ start:151 stop:729 length:579 start_codon:yes stop_codon:yes gene_type:complete